MTWINISVGAKPLPVTVTDHRLIVAQLPYQSPSEIDAALQVLSEFCVTNGTRLPEGLEDQLFHLGNPSVLVSLARYGQDEKIFNFLWDRATTAPISSDSDFFRKGLRRACVLNRLAPLNQQISLCNLDNVWDQKKLEWLTDGYHEKSPENEENYERWWDAVTLLQNESVPITILADAILRNGAFSKFDQWKHEALIRHISSNPLLAKKGRPDQDWSGLRDAVCRLLDARTRRPEFREAVFDLLLSLSPTFRGNFSVPSMALKQWQFPQMEEILATGGQTLEIVHGRADLMPLVAFATWPLNMPAASTPYFYTYAANYLTEDLTLRQMLDGIKRDGNLFCLLAIWNIRIMCSDTKRAMLQQMISGKIAMARPIDENELQEIYERRLAILRKNDKLVCRNVWAFNIIPSVSVLKWRVRLRRLLGLPTKMEEVMLEVGREVARY